MTDRYGNTRVAKIRAAYNDLRAAILAGDIEAAERALDRYEPWADYAFWVKPLVWEDHPNCDGPVLSRATALHGTYFIVDDTDDFSGLYLELVSHDKAKWWNHVRATCEVIKENIHDDDIAHIKAAAQADYERRILSALEGYDD